MVLFLGGSGVHTVVLELFSLPHRLLHAWQNGRGERNSSDSVLFTHRKLISFLLQMAGLSYSLSFNLRGVGLSFRGYGDKMPDLIDKVAEAAATYTPSDSVEFERLKDVVGRFVAV